METTGQDLYAHCSETTSTGQVEGIGITIMAVEGVQVRIEYL